MPSEVDIANQAIIMVGGQPINSLNDSSSQGIAVKTLYYAARDALLREIPWNFARAQVAINQLANVPINLDLLPQNFGPSYIIWTGAYALPLDFLRLYRFSPQDSHWRLISFPVGTGENQLAILTDAVPAPPPGVLFGNQPPNADGTDNLPGGVVSTPTVTQVGIEYIQRVTNPNRFDPLFVETLSAKLAMQIAQSQTGMMQMAQQMMQVYKDRLADAAFVNGAENWPDQLYETEIADVRYGYSGVLWSL